MEKWYKLSPTYNDYHKFAQDIDHIIKQLVKILGVCKREKKIKEIKK